MPLWRVIAWMIGRPTCEVVLRTLWHSRALGREHVPRTGPVLLVANHQSHLDPVIVGVLARDRLPAFFARSTLFAFKPFGLLISVFNAIPVRRDRAGTETIRRSIAELKEGRSLLVFPEGTRTSDGTTEAFKAGFLLLLKRADAQVVPVALEGARAVWPRERNLPSLRGRLLAKAGPAIAGSALVEMGEDAASEHLRRQLEEMRLELRAELRKASRGQWPPAGDGDEPYWNAVHG